VPYPPGAARPRWGMTTLYDCPDCALPATATWRGRHGSLDHVYLRCVVGHWFLGPLEMLIRRRPRSG
jgi:hypothetical protein